MANPNGQLLPRTTSHKAHDPLHARGIICDDGQTRLAIIIVDNCLIGRNYLDCAKALAAKQTKLRTDRILVAAIHTAPPGKDRRTNHEDPQRRAYFQKLVEGIAEAITQAEKTQLQRRWPTALR